MSARPSVTVTSAVVAVLPSVTVPPPVIDTTVGSSSLTVPVRVASVDDTETPGTALGRLTVTVKVSSGSSTKSSTGAIHTLDDAAFRGMSRSTHRWPAGMRFSTKSVPRAAVPSATHIRAVTSPATPPDRTAEK